MHILPSYLPSTVHQPWRGGRCVRTWARRLAAYCMIVATLACSPEPAADGDKDGDKDVAAELEALRDRHKLPALAGAAFSSDDLRGIGVVGTRKIGSNIPVTTSDAFALGSTSKSMTGTLVAILNSDGVSLDTTLGEVYPDIHEDYVGVTLRDLLGHRGGAPIQQTNVEQDLISQRPMDQDLPAQRAWMTKEVLTVARAAEPSAQPLPYSNIGYVIPAEVVRSFLERCDRGRRGG